MHEAYVLFVIFQTVELTDEETEAQRRELLGPHGHRVTEPGLNVDQLRSLGQAHFLFVSFFRLKL